MLPSMIPLGPTNHEGPVMASYNPPPASNFHAPLSIVSVIGLGGIQSNAQTAQSSNLHFNNDTNAQTIKQNALRFIIDSSYFPQSETTVAVDPKNPNHVVGGFNDDKFFFCPFLPTDCGGPRSPSLSGFTTSIDGGKTVAKSSNIPDLNLNGVVLDSWGDPSIAPSVDGNFFYASLAINPITSLLGNGVMIAKSNSSLFNPAVSCTTISTDPTHNACWNSFLIAGSTTFPTFTLEDKDRIAVDRNPSSPFYGSVYIGWDHFFPDGTSIASLVRCDNSLVTCVTLSDLSHIISGNDGFVAWTTPVVDKFGNVYLSWCNFGTLFTFGPVDCRISSSPPGGAGFGSPTEILSYMGTGTQIPGDTIVIGWATEQFRTGAGLISIAADQSPKSNNLYFTTNLCTGGHYYAFTSFSGLGVALDNPGTCGQSSIIFTESSDNGKTWTPPMTLSNPVVNDQPYVTVDPTTGNIYVVYYTTQYDPFNHLIDVVASWSNNQGKFFHQQRITSVSDDPNSDPNMYNYVVGGGFGGSWVVPQFGDYFEATARNGTVWILFTGNYAVEQGAFQADPFLAVLNIGA